MVNTKPASSVYLKFTQNDLSALELEQHMQPAFRLQENLVKEGLMPGGVLAVGNLNHWVWQSAGKTGYMEGAVGVNQDTLYDMASLTKLFTTFMALSLLEKGKYRLHDPVSLFLPEFEREDKKDITMFQLLTHTSGISPHEEFFRFCKNPQDMLKAIAELPLLYQPATVTAYSCLGFITLAQALEKIAQTGTPDYLRQNLFSPLGMEDSCFNPSYPKNRIAATEESSWDGKLCWGEVHDENARCQGGVSGNAGLFSTAKDLVKYAQMWLGMGSFKGQKILSPLTVQNSIINRTAALGGENRGLGWQLKSSQISFMGDLTHQSSFGHTGFTGTSILINPELGLFVIWLTNRVHPSRKEERIIRQRSLMHNLIFASLV